jgi:hypothetical protein
VKIAKIMESKRKKMKMHILPLCEEHLPLLIKSDDDEN